MMDLKSLQTVLSMGLDDVALLIHIIMVEIVTTPTSTGQAEGNTLDFNDYLFLLLKIVLNPIFKNLASFQNRHEWEHKFNKNYIQPVLKVMDFFANNKCIFVLECAQKIRRIKNPDTRG